jgi:hypothetical protein
LLVAACAAPMSTSTDAAPPRSSGTGGSTVVDATPESVTMPPEPPATEDAAAPTAEAAAPPEVAADVVADRPASTGSDGPASTSKDFTCSWILGITTTGEWYRAGFERVVEDARWQVTPIEVGHLEKWADPQNGIWQSGIQSPCAMNSKTPDRIVFMAVKYEWTTVAQFLPEYVAVINNIKTKYPSVKRVDLATYARGPGNKECVGANRSNDSYIKAVQDEAAAMIPAMFPGFVFIAPKWEVKSCGDFGLCPHISGAANATLAKTIGDYYLVN